MEISAKKNPQNNNDRVRISCVFFARCICIIVQYAEMGGDRTSQTQTRAIGTNVRFAGGE